MDADDIGAELGELGQHITVDALADRGQQDHRGDADGNPEQGQEAAQALRSDGAYGQLEGVGDQHLSVSLTLVPDRVVPRAVPA